MNDTTPNPTAASLPPDAFACGSKDAFELTGATRGWLVREGMVDVFLIDRSKLETGFRYHLLRVEAGATLFGATEKGVETCLLAVPGNNTVLLPFDVARPADAGVDLVASLKAWLTAIADAIAAAHPPIEACLLPEADVVEAPAGEVLAGRETPFWLKDLPVGVRYVELPPFGEADLPRQLPLTRSTWISLPAGSSVRRESIADWAAHGTVAADLASFHAFALPAIANRCRAENNAELLAIAERGKLREDALAATMEQLVKVVQDRTAATTTSPHALFGVCELVAQKIDVKLAMPTGGTEAIDNSKTPVRLIARASGVQSREVELPDAWWRQEVGPLIAFWADGRPCALLPRTFGGYDIVDPAQRIQRRATVADAGKIQKRAFQLCEPLPDHPVTLGDITRFAIRGAGIDTAVIIVMVLLSGALALVPPLATRMVFDSVIPSNQGQEAIIVGLGLFIAATAVALFNLVQGIALLRIEGRLDLRLQSALWDRLVRAPLGFFVRNSSGDLVARMQTVDTMRKLLTGSVVSTIISSVTGTFSLGLMIYYAPITSLILAALTLLFCLIGMLLGWRLVALDRQTLMLGGQNQSLVVQLLNMLAKLRVTATEDIAFQRCARIFRAAQVVFNKNAHAYVAMLSLMGILGATTLAVLFISLGLQSGELFAYFRIPSDWSSITGQTLDGIMPIPDFAAYISALVQFVTAVTGLMTVAIRLSAIPPLFGRLKPIFETPTEQYGARDNPGEIQGRIEFSGINFRYGKDTPLILKNLTFSVAPGEFVALVGPSGSGKSTALRLLLGFENQESGSIYLDGRDLAHLDKTLVREQLGVVVQDGRLIPGTIYDNLTGGQDISRDEVWEAARAAGFAADIEKMPEGLDTPINDGATNISGGQRQRLLIARALLRRPRMLVFDEATSALDNETQEIVTNTIQSMSITRIAVAHRLSTIMKADRIFVLVSGSIVESGTYEELLALNKEFAALVRKQA